MTPTITSQQRVMSQIDFGDVYMTRPGSLAERTAINESQIQALLTSQQATNANVNKLAEAMEHGLSRVEAKVEARSTSLEEKVDSLTQAFSKSGSWDWNTVYIIGCIATLIIGTLYYVQHQDTDALFEKATSTHLKDASLLDYRLNQLQERLDHITLETIVPASR